MHHATSRTIVLKSPIVICFHYVNNNNNKVCILFTTLGKISTMELPPYCGHTPYCGHFNYLVVQQYHEVNKNASTLINGATSCHFSGNTFLLIELSVPQPKMHLGVYG